MNLIGFDRSLGEGRVLDRKVPPCYHGEIGHGHRRVKWIRDKFWNVKNDFKIFNHVHVSVDCLCVKVLSSILYDCILFIGTCLNPMVLRSSCLFGVSWLEWSDYIHVHKPKVQWWYAFY